MRLLLFYSATSQKAKGGIALEKKSKNDVTYHSYLGMVWPDLDYECGPRIRMPGDIYLTYGVCSFGVYHLLVASGSVLRLGGPSRYKHLPSFFSRLMF